MAESQRTMLDRVVRERTALKPRMKALSEKADLSRSEGAELDQLLDTFENLTSSERSLRARLGDGDDIASLGHAQLIEIYRDVVARAVVREDNTIAIDDFSTCCGNANAAQRLCVLLVVVVLTAHDLHAPQRTEQQEQSASDDRPDCPEARIVFPKWRANDHTFPHTICV